MEMILTMIEDGEVEESNEGGGGSVWVNMPLPRIIGFFFSSPFFLIDLVGVPLTRLLIWRTIK